MSVLETKAVVKVASDYTKQLLDTTEKLRLEQVEQRRDHWSVILSMPDKESILGIFQKTGDGRLYKEILVISNEEDTFVPTALRFWKP